MNSLTHINIKVIKPLSCQPAGLSGNADAFLHEILALLEAFVATGQTGAIDLHGLPLTAADHEILRTTLGEGEVHAHINVIGKTEVRETLYPGVWWLTYYSMEEDIVADLLEVTTIPEILKAPVEDVREGLACLRDLLGPTTMM
uniref:HupH hydrogenase expression protein C-terminal domain-containing protein n=1 Tax=mine drainage metagenome TaxID=410659 RepID=E6QTI1_9ZZZZ